MAKEKTKESPPTDSAEKTELGQLREILFGQSNRDFQHQLDQLSARVEQHIQQLSSQLDEQVKQLNSTIDSRFDTLSKQLSEDSQQHQQNQGELKALHDTLKSELEMAEASAHDETGKLDTRLKKEMDELESMFNQRHQALLERLQQVTAELSTSKTDRKTLANLLSTMASNLATDQS
ncbi:hypothetical protein [Alteromonas sp. C1M14]|uniref:hypothetical protein n=1 Tax=Alteromonas sp. C1M14 TaxID=2841567 RepID=UPI001C08E875|nr:hypothetical protein [Alteromonas sp. C1M14]MBU2976620.1 hypothetical protein [Alteromonas sp. C1M14]